MNIKWVMAGIVSILCVLLWTNTPAQAASEYKLAEIKTTKAKFYKIPSKKAKTIAVTKSDLQRNYDVRESKKADGTTYYLIKKGTVTRGWVNVKHLKLTTRTTISKQKKTLYLLGKSNTYTLPATTAGNRLAELSNHRAKKFYTELYEKVGSTYWYKGKIQGTKQLVWVRSDVLTSNGYVSVDLRKPSNVTAKELQTLILSKGRTPDNVLYKLAPEFIKAQKSTGVSAQFMFAHAILETGWGGSTIAHYKNNFFGYQAYDSCPITCAKYFPKGEYGLQLYASRIVNNYLTPNGIYYNGKHVLGMNVKYATDVEWGEKIAGLMQQVKPYQASYYEKVKPSTKKVTIAKDYGSEIPTNRPQPNVFKKLPVNITAIVPASAPIHTVPYVYAQRIGTYGKNQKITLTAYHTDVRDFKNAKGDTSRWYRVNYQNKQGWVRSDQIQTTNIAFTKVTATLRKEASTSATQMGAVSPNTALKLATKSSKPITKKDKKKATWYQAYHPNTMKRVWIRSDLVKIYR